MAIRILLADDHEMMRAGLRSILEKAADMEVIAEAADGREAVSLARRAFAGHRADGHHDAEPQRHRGDAADLRGHDSEGDRAIDPFRAHVRDRDAGGGGERLSAEEQRGR